MRALISSPVRELSSLPLPGEGNAGGNARAENRGIVDTLRYRYRRNRCVDRQSYFFQTDEERRLPHYKSQRYRKDDAKRGIYHYRLPTDQRNDLYSYRKKVIRKPDVICPDHFPCRRCVKMNSLHFLPHEKFNPVPMPRNRLRNGVFSCRFPDFREGSEHLFAYYSAGIAFASLTFGQNLHLYDFCCVITTNTHLLICCFVTKILQLSDYA